MKIGACLCDFSSSMHSGASSENRFEHSLWLRGYRRSSKLVRRNMCFVQRSTYFVQRSTYFVQRSTKSTRGIAIFGSRSDTSDQRSFSFRLGRTLERLCVAPSGLVMAVLRGPRALPWAGICRPFGALGCLIALTQGVALSWYVSPLQGEFDDAHPLSVSQLFRSKRAKNWIPDRLSASAN
jgi:hypothetical protein